MALHADARLADSEGLDLKSDIGSDTLTGVNDADNLPPFPLTARLNKLTITTDRPQLSPEDIRKLEAAT